MPDPSLVRVPTRPDLIPFLRRTDVIDLDDPGILALASELERGSASPLEAAGRAFEWVRDQIDHSADAKRGPVTCRASDVLGHWTGFCYAKSHLLTALLRAMELPAGLCYQRLRLDGAAGFCLHGLCAVLLPGVGWHRLDPRGNKPGVDARFTPPVERLAFRTDLPGEADLPGVWPDPLPVVLAALTAHAEWEALLANLPDLAPPFPVVSAPG